MFVMKKKWWGERCLTAAAGLSVVINWNARLECARSSPPPSSQPEFSFSVFSTLTSLVYLCSSSKRDRLVSCAPERTGGRQIYPLSRAWSLLGPARNRVFFRIGVDGPVRTLRRHANTKQREEGLTLAKKKKKNHNN